MSLATMTHYGYTIHGPLPDAPVDLPYRSPSIRREPKLSSDHLRTLYRSSASPPEMSPRSGSGSVTIGPTTPILPPTPPHAEDDEETETQSPSDVSKVRSLLVTPVNQQSPPTPEITPPRDLSSRKRFLGAQPSMASTRAESFKTAHEEIPSDPESDFSVPKPRYGLGLAHSPHLTPLHTDHKPSPLAHMIGLEGARDSQTPRSSSVLSSPQSATKAVQVDRDYEESPVLPQQSFRMETTIDQRPHGTVAGPQAEAARRGPSLRERLQESRNVPRSPSIDKFASIIGWTEHVSSEDNKRLSGISTSTIEAFVVEQPRVRKKRGTLRHVSKNDSLRSVSSPLPRSDQASTQIVSESPHRLVHKKGQVTNHNRLSFGSEHSRSLSISSSIPPARQEIIKVAVIPERVSSLPSSERCKSSETGKSFLLSTSSMSIPLRSRRGSDSQSIQEQRKRTLSETGRGRDRYYPPQVGPYTVPPRSTSLSAPTSRTTSRANSLTSESLRFERKKAEKELRSTLSRMESERLASSLKSASDSGVAPQSQPEQPFEPELDMHFVPQFETQFEPTSSQIDVRAHDFAANVEPFPEHVVPGTREWADLRPPSILTTPFSAPSFLSASPEISEARIISLFPHNNHSVQLIEPAPIAESQAVRIFRRHDQARLHNESPFRDPRAAPQPPMPLPVQSTVQADNFSHSVDDPQRRTKSNRRRPSVGHQDRADSFAKALIRTVSLKHARNKRADQNLDSQLHPMWRPRPFWDDPDARKQRAEEAKAQDRGIVQNSVGIPVQRSIFSGPVGLMHRISNRRRDRKAIAKRSSYTSLQRLRTGRKLYRIPGLGFQLQFKGFRDIQDRIMKSRQKKEDERRELKREELRRSIGPNVIPTGDSRFPITTTATAPLVTATTAAA